MRATPRQSGAKWLGAIAKVARQENKGAMPFDRNDDRPKRSWKEIDQRKAGTFKPASDGADSRPEGRPSHAYNAYKTQLGRLFDQGGIGASPPEAAQHAARRTMERDLLQHTHPRALGTAAQAFVATHGLPQDGEVLMHLLAVDDEALTLQVVQALGVQVAAGGFKRTQALRARLQALAVECDAPKIRAAAKSILAGL